MYLYLHVVRKHMSCLQNFKNFLRLETWENGDKAYCFFVFYSPAVKNFPGSPVGIMSWLNCTKKGSNKVSLIHFNRGVQLYEYGVLVSPVWPDQFHREYSKKSSVHLWEFKNTKKSMSPPFLKPQYHFHPSIPVGWQWITEQDVFCQTNFTAFLMNKKFGAYLLLWAAWNSQIFSGDKDEMEILCSMPSLFSIAFLDVPIDIFWRFCQT